MQPTIDKIGNLCEMVKGSSPTMKTLPGGYPMVVTAKFRRSSDSYQFNTEAVCVPLVSSTGHGNAALHRVHYQSGKFALANLLVALIPQDTSMCDPKYLYFLLQAQKDFLLVPLMQGTANVSLKMKDIAQVEISLPSLNEQLRVVTIIESFVEKINEVKLLRQEILDDGQAMLQGVFHKLIEGAKYFSMAEVASIIRRKVEIDIDGEYPELGVRSFGKGTFQKPVLHGHEVGSKKLYSIEPGDLVFSNVFSWEGAIAVAKPIDNDRVGSHRFITCIAKQQTVTAPFLCFYFLVQEGLEKIREASPGGAGRNRTLGLKKLEKITVPVPDYNKQLWFDSLQQKVTAIKQAQADSQAKLDALLPSILDKAFKGEL